MHRYCTDKNLQGAIILLDMDQSIFFIKILLFLKNPSESLDPYDSKLPPPLTTLNLTINYDPRICKIWVYWDFD